MFGERNSKKKMKKLQS